MSATPWLFFPDYSGSSPYLELLGAELAPRYASRAGTIGDAVEAAVAGSGVVFHLHWEETLFGAARSAAEAAAVIGAALADLETLQACGGRLVWTMHNAAPHEDRFPLESGRLRAALARRADVVHVHGAHAAGLARELGADPARLLVAPHPNFDGAYPDDITDAAARRYFGLDAADTVFAFLGSMRSYKGLDVLPPAFARLYAAEPGARLILAGRHRESCDARFVRHQPGVQMVPRFIEHATVQYVLRAADYVVLPYRRVLTSGAMMLALSWARPVIVPDLPGLTEVVTHGRDALVFRTGDVDSLAAALHEACTLGAAARHRMRRDARATAERLPFRELAAGLMQAVAEPAFA